MAHSIKIIGLDGVSNIGLMGPVDLFAICNRIATRISGQEAQLFDVQLVSADGGPIISASGHTINMDSTLASINATDIVIVPALMLASQSELQAAIDNQQPFIQWLRDNAQTPALYATYCSGAFLLAEAGLAQHNAMTTAWFLTQHFKERYPAIELQENCMLTEGNGIICGGATTAYQDVVLRIVENCAGKHFARLLAKYMMMDNQRTSQAPYAILSEYQSQDPVVNKAEQWLRKNLHKEFKVEDIASHVAVSPRTLIRRFQNSLQESPQSLTQKLRIEKSKILLETTQLSLGEIIRRCGYQDESAFRRLFKRHCALSPREYRRRFNHQSLEKNAGEQQHYARVQVESNRDQAALAN